MNEPFFIPVTYESRQLEYKAWFERWDIIHRIAMLIDKTTVIFEQTKKAVTEHSAGNETPVPDVLLQAVEDKLVELIQ